MNLAYQRLCDRSETLNIELVLAQIQHLECPVPLQHLSDVGNAVPDVVSFQVQCLQSAESWQVVQSPDLLKEGHTRTVLKCRVKAASVSMGRM